MAKMCSFCGSDLKYDGYAHTCACGYIETDDMSYEEVCGFVESNSSENIIEVEIPF